MPTVPEYPNPGWSVGRMRKRGERLNNNNDDNGNGRIQVAMMEPRRAIPESGMAEAEKVITGAAAGAEEECRNQSRCD